MHGLGGPKAGGGALRAAGATLVVVLALLFFTAVASASGPMAAGAAAPAGAGGPTAAGAASATTATAPDGIVVPAPGSLIVVRRIAGEDSLWSVDPGTAMVSQLTTLPFRPASVTQSPGGRRLAYLPMSTGAAVYVYDISTNTLVKRSLAGRGVKVVD